MSCTQYKCNDIFQYTFVHYTPEGIFFSEEHEKKAFISHQCKVSNFTETSNGTIQNLNKRSKDLGALLDSCSRDDIGNFPADLYQKLTAAS